MLLQYLEGDAGLGDVLYASDQHDAHVMAFLLEWAATYACRYPEHRHWNVHWRTGPAEPDTGYFAGAEIVCSVGGRPALCASGLDIGNQLDHRGYKW
jgi:hypothetical protein